MIIIGKTSFDFQKRGRFDQELEDQRNQISIGRKNKDDGRKEFCMHFCEGYLEACRFRLFWRALVSNIKAARSSKDPIGGYEDEGIRHFKDYHGDGNMDGSLAAKEKGRVEHFGLPSKRKRKASTNKCIHHTANED